MRHPRTPSRLLPILALAAGLALAGCGSDGDDEAAAGPDPSAADGGEIDTPQEAALAYSECMRAEGVEDFPDPVVNEDGGIQMTANGIDSNDPVFQAAQETCEPVREQGGEFQAPDEAKQAEREAQVLEFAECMRDHGIDFPDPEVDGGRVTMRPGQGVDPGSPEFTEAQAACQESVGGMGTGGR